MPKDTAPGAEFARPLPKRPPTRGVVVAMSGGVDSQRGCANWPRKAMKCRPA